jgi:hypothetical protein
MALPLRTITLGEAVIMEVQIIRRDGVMYEIHTGRLWTRIDIFQAGTSRTIRVYRAEYRIAEAQR